MAKSEPSKGSKWSQWFPVLNKSQIGSSAFCQLCFAFQHPCWPAGSALPMALSSACRRICRCNSNPAEMYGHKFLLSFVWSVGSFGFVSAPSSTCYPLQLGFIMLVTATGSQNQIYGRLMWFDLRRMSDLCNICVRSIPDLLHLLKLSMPFQSESHARFAARLMSYLFQWIQYVWVNYSSQHLVNSSRNWFTCRVLSYEIIMCAHLPMYAQSKQSIFLSNTVHTFFLTCCQKNACKGSGFGVISFPAFRSAGDESIWEFRERRRCTSSILKSELWDELLCSKL